MTLLRFPLLINTLFLSALAISAAQAEELGKHGDWHAYKETENGHPVCVMSATPQKEQGDYTKRGEVAAIISHRPAEKRIGEISIQAGYPYKDGSGVTATVDGKKTFKMFTKGDHAWTYNAQADREFAAAMRAGYKLVIQGTSSRGTLTTDTYSLKGFTAAMNAIDKACGVK